MTSESVPVELAPGEFFFGAAPNIICTLLGSCVSATLWHPRILIGGMSHVIVPDRLDAEWDTRYPSCVVEQFVKYAHKYSTHPADYTVGIYGGGNMFPAIKLKDGNQKVGDRNVRTMMTLMEECGFVFSEFHTGGPLYRKITLHLESGKVDLKESRIETFTRALKP